MSSRPKKSSVHQFTAKEISTVGEKLIKAAEDNLQKKPFGWQLDCAKAILEGHDTVLDVGTGNGKTLCFTLPILTGYMTDISLIISPLSALMIDQVSTRLTLS